MGVKLGNYLRAIREEKGMSLDTLSTLSKYPIWYLEGLEEGKEKFQMFTAPILASVLDVPMEIINNVKKEEELLEELELLKKARKRKGEMTKTSKKTKAEIEKKLLSLNNPANVANYIVNTDLRAIVRTAALLSSEELKKLREVIEVYLSDLPTKQVNERQVG